MNYGKTRPENEMKQIKKELGGRDTECERLREGKKGEGRNMKAGLQYEIPCTLLLLSVTVPCDHYNAYCLMLDRRRGGYVFSIRNKLSGTSFISSMPCVNYRLSDFHACRTISRIISTQYTEWCI